MARARNIKPGFYKNEDLAECSIWARFIFPGLWMLADREGRLEDRPKRIKGELLPFDSHDAEPLLNELKARGFIERYEVDGRAFIQIVAFSKHQNPHHREPESNIPAPQSPRLSTDGTHKKPEALPPCNEPKARGKPEASLGLSPPKHDLEGGVNPADSLIPDSLIPDPGSSASFTQPESREQPEASTRKGVVCGLLRKAGMSDAAPHYLTDEVWASILSKRTDEEIVEVARAKMAARPGQRTGLKYIAPALLEDPTPIAIIGQQRRTIHDEREAVSIGLTGRKPSHDRQIADTEPRDITGESHRVA